jgi:hypothetical protein
MLFELHATHDRAKCTMQCKCPLADRGAGEGMEPTRLLYSYFTAGTGGAGPTILETTFLLAGEPTIAYKDGKKYTLPPVSERRTVDFGPGLGKKGCFLYNLPEVKSSFEVCFHQLLTTSLPQHLQPHGWMRGLSLHVDHGYAREQVLKVPSVSARFGTSPAIWNWATWLLARAAPKQLLTNRDTVKAFVRFVDPLVRVTDAVAGEAVGLRIELQLSDSKEAVGLFIHKRLSETVGSSVAGFAEALLDNCTEPGKQIV